MYVSVNSDEYIHPNTISALPCIFLVATQPLSGIDSVALFLSLLAEQWMTDDLLHALDIIESLRIYKVHQVVVTAL